MKKFIYGEDSLFTKENALKIAKLGFGLSEPFHLTNFYNKIDLTHLVKNLTIGKKLFLSKTLLNYFGIHIVKDQDGFTLQIEQENKHVISTLNSLADRAKVIEEKFETIK